MTFAVLAPRRYVWLDALLFRKLVTFAVLAPRRYVWLDAHCLRAMLRVLHQVRIKRVVLCCYACVLCGEAGIMKTFILLYWLCFITV